MKEMYVDGSYLERNPTWHVEDSRWKASQVARIINKNKLQLQSICEIGCGAGEILNSLQKQIGEDKEFFGYEISPQAYELCQNRAGKNLKFYLKDMLNEKVPFYDLVAAIDVFEHVEDYYGFIRKLKSKAKYKLFHIPLDLSVQTVLRASPMMKNRRLYGHIHYFTKEIALAAFNDTGYKVIDWFYTCGSQELPSKTWKGKLLKLPRKFFFAIHQDLTVRIFGGYSLLVLAE
jgi:cyclopropane fatty-acyl-phospholipid synthase-like methyltransferase